MYSDIEKLYKIANKQERTILGLMSGTSLDGLDIALCKIRGHGRNTKIKVDNFITMPYDDEFRAEVKKIFSIPHGDIQLLVLLHAHIGKMHGQLINGALKQWSVAKEEVDIIASHGQTIYHAPAFLIRRPPFGNATLQIGDGDHIAMETGITTIADFRMKHIAAGGEGAPLAVYGDYLIFSDEVENRVMLNIGGISNFTWLPNASLEEKAPCFSTDIGPGNTMMDAYVQKHFPGYSCDMDSMFASQGNINEALLMELCHNEFFDRAIPKTIGPELFNLAYLDDALARCESDLNHYDVMATLNKFTAMSIVDAIKKYVPQNIDLVIYPSGGGVHNPLLMNNIVTQLPNAIMGDIASLGVNGDAKEAVLFALLANECLVGKGMGLKHSLNGVPDVSMGKVCF